MKKKTLFLTILVSVSTFLVSCGEQQEMDDSNTSNVTPVSTRAFSADEVSISNPTLQTDWENVKVIKLNRGGDTDAPWVYKEGNSIDIPLNYRTDIKKEDGWIMLSHTMIYQVTTDPDYILFYNKYTGILKGFYFNRQNINNQSFLWALEAKNPTSIFCSNALIQGPMNTTQTYVTSSNIVRSSNFDFGQLNPGWNCFSFELCYGTLNNAPIISVKGFNTEESTINLSGNYSGEVVIPVTSEEPSGLKSLVSGISKVVGVGAAIIPQLRVVSTAISVASGIMGHTSLYKSKTNVTNIRATSSGKVELTGTSFTSLKGAATEIYDIDLKRLNNNNELGVWNLSATPEVVYPKCSRLMRAVLPTTPDDNDHFGYDIGNVNLDISDLYSLIVVNPALLSEINSYRIVEKTFFTQGFLRFKSLASAENYYPTDFEFYIKYNSSTYDKIQSLKRYHVNSPDDFTNMLLCLTIEFSYKNGSTVLSSRVFKPNFKCIDNMSDIKQSNSNAYFVYLSPTPEGPSE